MQVVYIDVLFLLNLVLNYFLLLAVSALFHRRDGRLRLLLASALGALYACLLFFPQLGFLYTAGLKLLCSAVLVAAAYRRAGLRGFFALLLAFYAVSMLFGGFLYALRLFLAPPGLAVRNGVGYLDLSPLVLILSGAGFYAAFSLFGRFFHRRVHDGDLYRAELWVAEKRVGFTALMDTGNSLRDPISGAPVVVAEYRSVEPLFPQSLRGFFRSGRVPDAEVFAADGGGGWERRVRMVPYGSVGRGGALPAFRPDGLAIAGRLTAGRLTAGRLAAGRPAAGRGGGREASVCTDVLVAVTGRRLSPEGEFTALLGPGLRCVPEAGGYTESAPRGGGTAPQPRRAN